MLLCLCLCRSNTPPFSKRLSMLLKGVDHVRVSPESPSRKVKVLSSLPALLDLSVAHRETKGLSVIAVVYDSGDVGSLSSGKECRKDFP